MIEEINTGTTPEEDESFARIHIPRNLDEITMEKAERDMKKAKEGIQPNYAKVTSLPMPEVKEEKVSKQDKPEEEED